MLYLYGERFSIRFVARAGRHTPRSLYKCHLDYELVITWEIGANLFKAWKRRNNNNHNFYNIKR